MSSFAAKNKEENNQKIVELSEYTSLNETRESNISNLYCEPFNPILDNRNDQANNSPFSANVFNINNNSFSNLPNVESPNLRYKLPARSLQPEPDGSSNPEINLAGKDNRQTHQLQSITSNSDNPGNAVWNTNVCYDNCRISKSSSGNNNSSIVVDNIRKSPNNNSGIGTTVSTTLQNGCVEKEEDIESKESFGSRFMRLFGSKRKKNGKKRSKSCEASSENTNKHKSISGSSVAPIATNPKVKFLVDSERISRRSASASPDMLIAAGRKVANKNNLYPDSLDSKLTHDSGFYNFDNKLDLDTSSGSNSQHTTGSSEAKYANHLSVYQTDNQNEWEKGNDFIQEQIETNFNHIMIQPHPHSIFYGGNYNDNRPKSKQRKSSGYDSLDGDEENSSMDSGGSHQNKAENISEIQWSNKREAETKADKIHNLNEKNRNKTGQSKTSSGGVFKRFLSKHPSRSNSTNFTKASIAEEEINSHEAKIVFQDANEIMRRLSHEENIRKTSETSKAHVSKPLNMEILQYDEMDILRMDFRSKQVSSSLASTTNNSHSSTYSSTHS